MDIARELEPLAREAAKIVGQQKLPGDFTVIINGTINPDETASVRWEWYWRPPTESVPDGGPVKL